jgi:hypothetical protein
MITIVRDPKELITSDLAMSLFYSPDSPLVADRLNIRVDIYADLYESLVDNSEFIIDYDDLISFPYETVKALSVGLGFAMINDSYIDTTTDQPEIGHLKSSKDTDAYRRVEEIIPSLNLTRMYEIYNRGLGKSISLLKVLCFNCGGMYKVTYGPNPTSKCPKCNALKTL